MARVVRTAAGAKHYGRPIGSVIGSDRRRKDGSVQRDQVRVSRVPGKKPRESDVERVFGAPKTAAKIKTTNAKIKRTVLSIKDGTAPPLMTEWASPRKRAEQIKLTGSPKMPAREAIGRAVSMERSRKDPRTAVGVSPFTGKYVTIRRAPREVIRADGSVTGEKRVRRQTSGKFKGRKVK